MAWTRVNMTRWRNGDYDMYIGQPLDNTMYGVYLEHDHDNSFTVRLAYENNLADARAMAEDMMDDNVHENLSRFLP